MDVVKLIFSLKGIQPEILNEDGNNVFLLACYYNANIKVIKYIHKLFPSMIYSQSKNIDAQRNRQENTQNGTNPIFNILYLGHSGTNRRATLNILHYLYLNCIDIHFLSNRIIFNRIIYSEY